MIAHRQCVRHRRPAAAAQTDNQIRFIARQTHIGRGDARFQTHNVAVASQRVAKRIVNNIVVAARAEQINIAAPAAAQGVVAAAKIAVKRIRHIAAGNIHNIVAAGRVNVFPVRAVPNRAVAQEYIFHPCRRIGIVPGNNDGIAYIAVTVQKGNMQVGACACKSNAGGGGARRDFDGINAAGFFNPVASRPAVKVVNIVAAPASQRVVFVVRCPENIHAAVAVDDASSGVSVNRNAIGQIFGVIGVFINPRSRARAHLRNKPPVLPVNRRKRAKKLAAPCVVFRRQYSGRTGKIHRVVVQIQRAGLRPFFKRHRNAVHKVKQMRLQHQMPVEILADGVVYPVDFLRRGVARPAKRLTFPPLFALERLHHGHFLAGRCPDDTGVVSCLNAYNTPVAPRHYSCRHHPIIAVRCIFHAGPAVQDFIRQRLACGFAGRRLERRHQPAQTACFRACVAVKRRL